MYSIQQIIDFLNINTKIDNDYFIEFLITDSRKIAIGKNALFFAINTPRRKGIDFIEEAYNQGVRNFVVDEHIETHKFCDANFLFVNNTLKALQLVATKHRQQFNIPIIGITGSNGKTIVKEWLYQLLNDDFSIVRSPKSYNSQIGVPLSVWQINNTHDLGIFEAGISTTNEMQNLAEIIQPTIGILTNIGDAHSEGFYSKEEKLIEKTKLFNSCNLLIVSSKNIDFLNIIKKKCRSKLFIWGSDEKDDLQIIKIEKSQSHTKITTKYFDEINSISIPFTDEASIENACICYSVIHLLKIDNQKIKEKFLQLQSIEMRLQQLSIVNGCKLINDSYSNDFTSFLIALNYLVVNAGDNKKTIILTDFSVPYQNNIREYNQLIDLIISNKIDKFIGIGSQISSIKKSIENLSIESYFYVSVEEFLKDQNLHQFKDEYILLKGLRALNVERIAKWLQHKTHQTTLEINLTALINNVKKHQQIIAPNTKLMAMVKAFSYGSGCVEIARVLQFHKVDYLAVAYTDEGIDLRKAGIHLPIMVLNVDEENFDTLIQFDLEPEIFSFSIYNKFKQYLQNQGLTNFPVHIKINTGMNRLGFDINEVDDLSKKLASSNTMLVKSVLSHLASSEEEKDNDFTNEQLKKFDYCCDILLNQIKYSFIKHIANSAAVFKHKNAQYNMVRLGIAMYGVDSSKSNKLNLETVATLKTTIAQIRKVSRYETVGYNRRGVLERDSIIATIRIGYADGLSRSLGNKNGFVFVKNKLAPIIGNVCMDMTMIDITDIDNVNENDEVEIFGANLPIQQVAKWSNTIPYETLSTISQRVRRIYLEE